MADKSWRWVSADNVQESKGQKRYLVCTYADCVWRCEYRARDGDRHERLHAQIDSNPGCRSFLAPCPCDKLVGLHYCCRGVGCKLHTDDLQAALRHGSGHVPLDPDCIRYEAHFYTKGFACISGPTVPKCGHELKVCLLPCMPCMAKEPVQADGGNTQSTGFALLRDCDSNNIAVVVSAARVAGARVVLVPFSVRAMHSDVFASSSLPVWAVTEKKARAVRERLNASHPVHVHIRVVAPKSTNRTH